MYPHDVRTVVFEFVCVIKCQIEDTVFGKYFFLDETKIISNKFYDEIIFWMGRLLGSFD